MDYRHPIKQIANKWMAQYRDDYPFDPSCYYLNEYVNSAIQEINDSGFSVMADGTMYPIAGVSIVRTGERLNVEYIFE